MTEKIEIKLDAKRLEESVTIDEFIAIQDGDIKATRNVLALFVLDGEGNYLEKEEGLKVIGKMTVKQLKEVMVGFVGKAEDALVPKVSNGGSA